MVIFEGGHHFVCFHLQLTKAYSRKDIGWRIKKSHEINVTVEECGHCKICSTVVVEWLPSTCHHTTHACEHDGHRERVHNLVSKVDSTKVTEISADQSQQPQRVHAE